ncbi:DNA gyrase subunit A [Olsenella profusa DSM 13989]|uniref:DNA gyrase subunit A n=2 Tax=Olsenella profusa TaxID=138595 RepID=U2THQ5_9ACTN|nr:DNA gyrase, A subunit [Olsenella profusa F0195]MDP9858978.1 DNA gyrase subunit A [Olsenella profusa DSM 13989]
MADDTNNQGGMGAGDGTRMPDDLRELLDRAEHDQEGSDTPIYDPGAEDETGLDDGDDGALEVGEDDREPSDEADIHGGSLQFREFGHEMEQSFIEYSMSVITARALPDVRDGLKPVHRRILYAMNEAGIFPNKPHKKSAWTVGEVIGKYHPHGDSAVYDAMVRLAQWFSMRVPLVDGHGNFGNIDGDSAAAMRYTESRLARPAMELLRDLNKDTVDWQPNYDESLQEPDVLPARFPNLLVNGSQGIAVGMATNIPPHNLGEAIDATCMMIDNPEVTVDELMGVMPGPDFPTAGVIMGSEGIKQAYETGRGIITLRAKAHVESTKGGRNKLVFTEFPYGVNKGNLQEKIAALVNEKRIEGIVDMRDESNRKGLRLVMELKQGTIPEVVLNNLYKYSSLQASFGIIDLALVDGVPKLLSLSEILRCYIDHQVDVVTRRTKFDLAKAKARAHILEGLLVALDHIDEVISIIRSSRTDAEASERLIARFSFTKEQTTAILEMRLRRLTGLERDKLQDELDGLRRAIAYYEELLADKQKILAVIKSEMLEIKERFADRRRTTISDAPVVLDVEDLIAEEDMVITVTHAGYVKRLPVATYRSQKRGGKGIQGLSLKDNDFVKDLFVASTHDYVLFFTNRGKVYRVKVHELPIGSRHARGSALVNVIPLEEGEHPTAVITTREFPADEFLMFATKSGMVKKTAMSDYDKSRRDGIIAINLKRDDELVNVRRVRQGEKVILCSTAGKAILFDESEIRPTSRATSGVRGIALKDGARMLDMEISNGKGDLLVITERGYGKRTPVAEYPEHKRGGQGVATISMTAKKGDLVACRVVGPQHELMIVSEEGVVIRVKTADISRLGRATQGVRIMNLSQGDLVGAVARMVAHKKKAAKAGNPLQGTLDLASVGAREADDEEPVDIGGEEELDDTLIEEDAEE